jgi:low temperature requirement protein LtrA
MLFALRGHDDRNFRNFRRIVCWLACSAAFWLAGGLTAGAERVVLWVIALGIEYLAPVVGFAVPGLGRSTTADWKVDGAHMAERCALFVIIALGESILVTGATAAKLPVTLENTAAFLVAFIGSVAMWWIYFNIGAEAGSRRIAGSSDPGRLARIAYTYMHLPLVAGIIGAAVGDELVLAHPTGHLDGKTAAALLGGPALYLVGNLMFKRTIADRPALSHMVGLALLAATIALVPFVEPLTYSLATTSVLVLVAVWETLSLRTRRHLE